MFAAATREVVFSNPDVVRKVKGSFVPVALKAGAVNNPPPGLEGDLYAEIGRSKPAPQGICTANSAGKVLAWALSFDDDASIPRFLDHVLERYRAEAGAGGPVTAERFMRYPGRKLPDVPDNGRAIEVPEDARHATPHAVPRGTLVGRIIGRALDADGEPLADTVRQEHYMEARVEIPPGVVGSLLDAVGKAGGERFSLPDDLVRSLVGPAYLGMLDVNPMGVVPGSRNDSRFWAFFGQAEGTGEGGGEMRVRITGRSHLAGGQGKASRQGGPAGDGRFWEHAVALDWQGYVDLGAGAAGVTRVDLLARGHERLRWGNSRLLRHAAAEPDSAHLMAGHPIDLDGGVVYGIYAQPAPEEEIADAEAAQPPVSGGPSGANRSPQPVMRRLQAKMQRLQARVGQRALAGQDTRPIARRMQAFGPLMRERKWEEAEALLDAVLEDLQTPE